MREYRYRCSLCGAVVTEAANEVAVCNGTDECGVLFDDERIPLLTVTKRNTKFKVVGSGADYYEGEDRPYEVYVNGQMVGYVERTWGSESENFVERWAFGGAEGKTRLAAVQNAYAV